MRQNEEFEMESRELIKFKLRREATQKFLLAYKLRKRLGAVATEDNETTMKSDNDSDMREKCAHLVRPFDHDIGAGQVRVLSGVESIFLWCFFSFSSFFFFFSFSFFFFFC